MRVLRASPEPNLYVAVQMKDFADGEDPPDEAPPDVELVASRHATYHLPPVLRLSRVLGFSLFGILSIRARPQAADAARPQAAPVDAADAA